MVGPMQIPPTTTLLNLTNALPVQGIAAAPPTAKGPQTVASPPPAPSTSEGRQPPSGRAPRGSIINILA